MVSEVKESNVISGHFQHYIRDFLKVLCILRTIFWTDLWTISAYFKDIVDNFKWVQSLLFPLEGRYLGTGIPR